MTPSLDECAECGKEFDRSKGYGIRNDDDGVFVGWICPACFPARKGESFNNWGNPW